MGLGLVAVHGHLVVEQLHEAHPPHAVARERRLHGGAGLGQDARAVEAGEVPVTHAAVSLRRFASSACDMSRIAAISRRIASCFGPAKIGRLSPTMRLSMFGNAG